MFQILGSEGEHDPLFEMKLRDTHLRQTTLTGACEDDCEVTAPLLNVCPEETGYQNGAPLYIYNPPIEEDTRFQADFDLALKLGFDFSVATTLGEYREAHGRDHHTGAKLEIRTMGFLDPDDRFEIGDPSHIFHEEEE